MNIFILHYYGFTQDFARNSFLNVQTLA